MHLSIVSYNTDVTEQIDKLDISSNDLLESDVAPSVEENFALSISSWSRRDRHVNFWSRSQRPLFQQSLGLDVRVGPRGGPRDAEDGLESLTA